MLKTNYRPQGKVIISEACVILFTGGIETTCLQGKPLPPPNLPTLGEDPLELTCHQTGSDITHTLLHRACDQTGSDIIHSMVLTSSSTHCNGWYASYWNAFLCLKSLKNYKGLLVHGKISFITFHWLYTKTRKHSSRMCTARFSDSGVSLQRPLDRDLKTETSWTETPLWTDTLWTEDSLDGGPPGRSMGPETDTP